MKSEDVYLIVFPPKVGKSLFELQFANSIANGLSFIWHQTFKSSLVLYITTDTPKKQLIMRVNALGITFNKKSFFVIEGDKYLKVNLKDNEYKIKEFVEDYNGKVMIIDMFKDVDFGISYNINDYQDIVQNLMPIIRNLASKYVLTVLLVHHTNKIGKTLGSIGFDAVVDGISQHQMNYHNKIYSDEAGVKKIRLHDFRHSCASLLVNKGANVQVVAKYLGHTKVEETLKTYSHLFTSTLDEVVAIIDNLDNNKTDDV